MIKGVIFDCFGVLTTDGWLAFRQRYFLPGDVLETQAIDLNRQSDAGFIAHQDFIRGVAELAGVDYQVALEAIDQSHVANEQLFVYIRDRLKPEYKIGLLSNAGDNYLDELFSAWQVALFDAVAFSYELGVIKPHPLMYQTIASKLGLTLEECLFIDDREGFVGGAIDTGMQSFLFTDTARCQAEIEERLGRNA